jgi:myosin-1
VPPPPPSPAAASGPKKAKALYDFNSDNSSMLSIKAGELVQIMSKEGNGK